MDRSKSPKPNFPSLLDGPSPEERARQRTRQAKRLALLREYYEQLPELPNKPTNDEWNWGRDLILGDIRIAQKELAKTDQISLEVRMRIRRLHANLALAVKNQTAEGLKAAHHRT
jgi:hypothetical protein